MGRGSGKYTRNGSHDKKRITQRALSLSHEAERARSMLVAWEYSWNDALRPGSNVDLHSLVFAKAKVDFYRAQYAKFNAKLKALGRSRR